MKISTKMIKIHFVFSLLILSSFTSLDEKHYFITSKTKGRIINQNSKDIIINTDNRAIKINNDIFIYEKNDSLNIFNSRTKEIIRINSLFTNWSFARTNNSFFILANDTLFNFDYNLNFIYKNTFKAYRIYPYNNELILFEKDNKFGLIKNNHVMVEAKYNRIFEFSQQNLLNLISLKYGITYDSSNLLNLNRKFNHKNFTIIELNKKMGIIDSLGNILIEPKYNCIWDYSDNFLIAIKNKKCVLLNNKGIEISDKYDQIGGIMYNHKAQSNFFWNYCMGLKNFSQVCFLKEIHEFLKYDKDWFGNSEGFIRAKKDGKWGFIDEMGKIICNFKYNFARNFNDGFSAVKLYGKWGFINRDGISSIKCKYNEVSDFKNGHAFVKIKNKWGMIDSVGKVIIPPQFNRIDITAFNEIIAYIDKKIYVFDSLNKKTEYNGDSAYFLSDNLLALRNNGKWRTISKKGENLLEFVENTWIVFCKSKNSTFGYIIQDHKKGIINNEGKLIIPPIYDDLDFIDNQYFIIKINEKKGLIDTLNNVIIPPRFDYADYDYKLEQYEFSCHNIEKKIDSIYYYDRKLKLIWKGVY